MPLDLICTVDGAGAGIDSGTSPKSQTLLGLTDTNGSFAKMEFAAVDEAKREILAAALAAISNKAKVSVSVDDPNNPPGPGPLPMCYSLMIFAP